MRLYRPGPGYLEVREIAALDDQRLKVPLKGIKLDPPDATLPNQSADWAFNGIPGDRIRTGKTAGNAGIVFAPLQTTAPIRMLVVHGPVESTSPSLADTVLEVSSTVEGNVSDSVVSYTLRVGAATTYIDLQNRTLSYSGPRDFELNGELNRLYQTQH